MTRRVYFRHEGHRVRTFVLFPPNQSGAGWSVQEGTGCDKNSMLPADFLRSFGLGNDALMYIQREEWFHNLTHDAAKARWERWRERAEKAGIGNEQTIVLR